MPIRVPVKKDGEKARPKDFKRISKTLKRKRGDEELEQLDKAALEFDPAALKDFSELPISKQSATGLDKSHFKTLTDIQRKAIPLALKGRDVLGAAKTGSGKTLAFILPVLEVLYRKKWTQDDGLGALIISPTRELAIQIFEVLRKVGQRHAFSAGLVIGGKSLQEEKERLGRMNILVCTPGRMLQHLDQNPDLDINNVQLLVLDEADRILDMGFKTTIDAILQSIPKDRQTLLFSATQTKNVSDLARLSLKDPEYVAVHESATSATPTTLQQHYIITPLPEKLDTLWSFIRSNVKAKILVFLSSTKQVRFVYETFRQMQPGIPLMHLHGRQKQFARADITNKFSSSKNACLLATDVVARGLDFPAVDWVVQVDCPEDADTYIHRVGRTARYGKEGRAVLFLCPSEEDGMLKRLSNKKIPIEKINVRQAKKQSIKPQLTGFCFKDPQIKFLGQKAFVSYVRSIYVQKDKEVFQLEELPVEEFATSLGLPGAPKIKFMKGEDVKAIKNAPRGLNMSESDDDGVSEDSDDSAVNIKEKKPAKKEVRTKYDRMFERQNQDVLTAHFTNLVKHDDHDQDEENDDFLKVKKSAKGSSSDDDESEDGRQYIEVPGKGPLLVDSKRRQKIATSKKAMLKYKGKGTKLVFDSDGEAHELYELEDEANFKQAGPAEEQRNAFLSEESKRVGEADEEDRAVAKEKRRVKKEKRKMRLAEEAMEDYSDGDEGYDDVDDGGDDDDGDDDGDGDGDDNHGGVKLGDAIGAEEAKRPKKWFEDDSEEERRKEKKAKKQKKDKGRVIEIQSQNAPETLEDLESLAAGLLS